MSRSRTVRMTLVSSMRFGGRLYLAGSVVEIGADLARQLLHQRRAVLVDPADIGVLLDAPRVTRH